MQTNDAKVQMPDTKLETPGAEVETPDTKIGAPDAKVETPGAQVETLDAKVETPGTKVETPDAEVETPDAKAETSNAKVETQHNAFRPVFRKKTNLCKTYFVCKRQRLYNDVYTLCIAYGPLLELHAIRSSMAQI